MTQIFFDAEFTGLHQNTSLISLALISSDGHSFYAEFTDYDTNQVDAWLMENVVKHLHFLNIPPVLEKAPIVDPALKVEIAICGITETITWALRTWLTQFDQIEMWGDCLAYDWVLFCQLFGGGAECLPRNVYYIPFDLATLFKIYGIDPDVSRRDFAGLAGTKHDALDDARTIEACYKKVALNARHFPAI